MSYCRKVVSGLCVGLAETINKVGPGLLTTSEFHDLQLTDVLILCRPIEGEQIATIPVQVLDQKAICQQDPDQDETEDAPEDQAEFDSLLIASAGDLVAALANALGKDFAPMFQTFFPLIAKYYASVPLLFTTSLVANLCVHRKHPARSAIGPPPSGACQR